MLGKSLPRSGVKLTPDKTWLWSHLTNLKSKTNEDRIVPRTLNHTRGQSSRILCGIKNIYIYIYSTLQSKMCNANHPIQNYQRANQQENTTPNEGKVHQTDPKMTKLIGLENKNFMIKPYSYTIVTRDENINNRPKLGESYVKLSAHFTCFL